MGKSRRSVVAPAMIGLAAWLLLAGAGCGEVSGGGTDESGSFLRVTQIVPRYDGEANYNVDAFSHLCDDGTFESLKDHVALATISNNHLPTQGETETASIVQITSYQGEYRAVAQDEPIVPAIRSEVVRQTVTIGPGESWDVDVILMPIYKKIRYVLTGVSPYAELPYSAEYVFFGEDSFGHSVSASGATFFNIADFDTCESSEP